MVNVEDDKLGWLSSCSADQTHQTAIIDIKN